MSGIFDNVGFIFYQPSCYVGKSQCASRTGKKLFYYYPKWIPIQTDLLVILIGLVIVGTCYCIYVLVLWNRSGSAIRATGNNADMIRALGVNTSWMKIIALLFSNGLVALSGALVTQYQQNASVTNGTGTIVVGLASVIIGEVIFGNRFNFIYKLSSVVIGSVNLPYCSCACS